ncbi:cGMP-dependent protein kinase 1-like [Oscarella lobularis]|uniref:cGMP-dependent protein kinase 1-like n=1 Tax=Oscarella lobularis TaxID=121494 RepID=UPI0033140E97
MSQMGNAASATRAKTSETGRLQDEIKRKDQEITGLQAEVERLHAELAKAQRENKRLSEILHATLDVADKKREKKIAVSAEPGQIYALNDAKAELKKYPKDAGSKELIKRAISNNDFMQKLEKGQIAEMVDCMIMKDFKKDQYIIREGSTGTELYVIAEGSVEVVVNGENRGEIGTGVVFGELAILYDCKRTAHVKATSDCRVWALERRTYQTIMQRTNMTRQNEYKEFLKKTSLFSGVPDQTLSKIADSFEEDVYNEGEFIIRQGGPGDTFYIIREGRVSVSQRGSGDLRAKEIRKMGKGEHFGEMALTKPNSKRTANVKAETGVTVLTLEREAFHRFFGAIDSLKNIQFPEYPNDKPEESLPDVDPEYKAMRLDDLHVINTLGMGGFGRVELVTLQHDKTKSYALKCLKKKHIVETRQQEHIYSEKAIMIQARCPFITRLYRTFRDAKYLYMLMEVCLGGELWTILRDRGQFDDPTSRFYVACVVEAFQFLHERGIIYRDLKPENLLLDADGYVKLVDFGFAKKIGFGRKTWTFCGTPEYVAPEIILNKGHDFSADYWSLGILMYELLTGSPPFSGSDPMKTYNIILKGMDMIEFPRKFPRNAYGLIKRLCRENPAERLGNQKEGIHGIKKHRWFEGFDWEGLVKRSLEPPIKPTIMSALDCHNFDKYPPEDPSDVPPDDTSGWDLNF